MKAYKGFDKDLKCRDFQYEIGKEYEESKASLCYKGFHACEHPLNCFKYYPPAKSRYCEVEIDDNGERSTDSKVCGKKIKIGAEIDIPGLIKAAFEFVKSKCTNFKDGGDYSALNGGNFSVIYGGKDAEVKAKKGSVLALQYWFENKLECIKFVEVDGVKIKEDTFYKLDENGDFVEADIEQK